MKRSIFFVSAAAAYAVAQNASADLYTTPAAYATSTPTPSYSLSSWTSDDCTSLPDVTITTTATSFTTYCSECDMMTTGGSEMMTMGGSTVHTTVWTTVGVDFCPNGTVISGTTAYMTPHTYTVTESCSMPTPAWSNNSTWVPSAMVTVTQVCDVCGEMGMTATMTIPASCTTYPPGVTTLAATPASSVSWSQASSTAASATASASAPSTAFATASATPSTMAASTSPASSASSTETTSIPMAATTPVPYDIAPEVSTTMPSGVASASGAAIPASWGNTTGITPYTGSASTFSVGSLFTLFSTLFIAAGAFLL